jgi:anti-sigma factor RsiW
MTEYRHPHRWQEELGAYLVGALEPDEAERVRRHLAACPRCRAEYAELAPVVGLLATVPAEALSAAAEPAVEPGEELWDRLRARAGIGPQGPGAGFAAEPAAGLGTRLPAQPSPSPSPSPATPRAGRGPRRPRRPLRPATAATISGVLVAAAATGIFVGVHHNGSGSPVAGTETVTATDAADGVSGTVQYGPTSWGSWVQITLKGVKPGDDCVLYALDRRGDKAVASSWWAPPVLGESAVVPGGVSMQASDIVNFQVSTSLGEVLLNIPAT